MFSSQNLLELDFIDFSAINDLNAQLLHKQFLIFDE